MVHPTFLHSIDALAYNALNLGRKIAWVHRHASINADPAPPDSLPTSSLSWLDILSLTHAYKTWLEKRGIQPGDRVAWIAPNSLSWILLELGCNWLGAVSCPIDPRIGIETLYPVLDKLSPRLLLISPALWSSHSLLPGSHRLPDVGRSASTRISSDSNLSLSSDEEFLERLALEPWSQSPRPLTNSLATILLTSGTSGGVPKGVMLSHDNLMLNAAAKLSAMPQQSADHRINILPFAHAYARTCELTAWILSGSSLECVPTISSLIRELPHSNATLLNAVPLVFHRLYEQWKSTGGTGAALAALLGPHMRQLASGGAPIQASIRQEFEDAGYPIFQGYGLTETSPVVCSNINSPETKLLAGVGPPVQGMEIRLDEESNLYVRGSGVMLGYWQEPEATAERFFDLDNSGHNDWFKTGDVASISEMDGTVTIHGRSDETIVLSNGYKLHPLDLESSLKQTLPISDCIAIPAQQGSWQLCVQPSSTSINWSQEEWLEAVKSQCSKEIRSLLTRTQIHLMPWTIESGLLNFKGGKRRHEFIRQFGCS